MHQSSHDYFDSRSLSDMPVLCAGTIFFIIIIIIVYYYLFLWFRFFCFFLCIIILIPIFYELMIRVKIESGVNSDEWVSNIHYVSV